VQVDPIKPTLKVESAWNKALETKYHEPLSRFGFKLDLRRYSLVLDPRHHSMIVLKSGAVIGGRD
jgi:hypothetical protein